MKGDFKMKRIDQDRPIQSPKTPVELEETVRRRAYQIYEQRGMADGREVEDWLEAEAKLLEDQRAPKAA
jgi:Protein of unknown function (DUF2934)